MKKILSAVFIISLTGALYAQDTVRFTILSDKAISGKLLSWSTGTGKASYRYEYNDRGRGPKLFVDLSLENGQIVSRKGWGVDYFKGAVSESFELSSGVAKWKNNVEDGSTNVSGPSYYSPLNGTPAEIEWGLKLALKQTPHELNLLPSGKLTIKHVKSHTAKVSGFNEELELYAFSGTGGPPQYVWVTPKKDFFAVVGGWQSTIKLGYEFLIPELKSLQDKIEDEYFVSQAYTLTQKQNGAAAIVNVSVFNSRTGKVVPNQTVIFEKGKIVTVGKSKSIQVPPDHKIINGEGKMLLPGLWDNHSHFNREQGLFHLAAGVTNVKDMGNGLDLPDLKTKIDKDELLGPDISIWSGFIDFAGPYAGPTGKIVKTKEEAITAINYYADRGYHQIKLYSSIPVDWVKPLADEAHKRNMKVCGHIPSGMIAERAVNDGYDQIIHMNMIMLNFLGDTIDTRSMGRFTKVGERAKNINVNGPEVKKLIKLLKEKQTVVDPTLAIFENMFTDDPGKIAKGYASVQQMFPSEIRRGLLTGGHPARKGRESAYNQSFDNMMKMLKVLNDNKITIVPGTDAGDGFTFHRELELWVKAGISPVEVLKKATIVSAQVAGKDALFGSIEVGKAANMVLISGDPTKNISDIRKVELTIEGGHLYDSKNLYQTYGFGFWK